MRILLVTPYPPSRIRVRSYGFLTALQHEHEVTCVTQCSSEKELADVANLRSQGYEVEVVQESKRQAFLRSGVAILSSQPLQVAYARSTHFKQAVQRLCSKRTFDVVHVEHLRGIASMQAIIATHPVVWDAVDCISLLFKYSQVDGPSLPVRTVARLEYKRTHSYESQLLNKIPNITVTSERDREAMLALKYLQFGDLPRSDGILGPSSIDVVSNGVDLVYFHPSQQKHRRFNIVFSGKMSYHANVATAIYLYRQIMPLIWKELPEAILTLVGSNPPGAVKRLVIDSRVEVTGFVEDIRPYISRARVMLSPMVYSVGIQNKVLEAMALGTPVVVARQAAASLGARDGRDLLVADSPQEFANYALRLMQDDELHAKISSCGRAYVEQNHDWRVVTNQLVEVYRRVIASRSKVEPLLTHT